MNSDLLARLILLQMRQSQQLTKALYFEVSKERSFGNGLDALIMAQEFLGQAEKLVAESAPPPVS